MDNLHGIKFRQGVKIQQKGHISTYKGVIILWPKAKKVTFQRWKVIPNCWKNDPGHIFTVEKWPESHFNAEKWPGGLFFNGVDFQRYTVKPE